MKRCLVWSAVLVALFMWTRPAIAGEKYDITFNVSLLGADPWETRETGDVVHIYYPAVYNSVEFTEGPLAGLSGVLTWEGMMNTGPTVSVGSGTGVLLKTPSGDVVFLTKWHFKWQLTPLEPFVLTVIGMGVGEFDGVWFEASTQGFDPYASYTSVGTLMNPKAKK